MEKGCASDPAMKALKESDEDKYKEVCTKVREDGKYVDSGENDNLIVQKLDANPQAVGIFGYSYLEENLNHIRGIPLNGVEPTYDNIADGKYPGRSEEHTSELQSLMRISYDVFSLQKKTTTKN